MTSFRECYGSFEQEHKVTDEHIETIQTGESSRSWFFLLANLFHVTFLPEGFPASVGEDYVPYQIWDITQALCGAVTGTLSTRAILAGVGVGVQSASVISGTLQWIVRDGTGMIGRIFFASYIASDLDNDAKRWRLAADCCNDLGILLEISCSMVPRAYFLVLVCIAAIFKAVTAVAGLATRSTMSQHFAIRQNMADIWAKNGSQETAVSFIGMFVGILVAAFVPPTPGYTTFVFILITYIHLTCNVKAVRSLIYTHYNSCRLDICLCQFLAHEQDEQPRLPTPKEMRYLEGFIWQNPFKEHLPVGTPEHIIIGASLTGVAKEDKQFEVEIVRDALSVLKERTYVLVQSLKERKTYVILRKDVVQADLLRAYSLARMIPIPPNTSSLENQNLLEVEHPAGVPELHRFNSVRVVHPSKTDEVVQRVERFLGCATEAGWKIDRVLFKLKEWRVIQEGDHSEENITAREVEMKAIVPMH